MTNKTRRHIWSLAVMSLAAVGTLAVVVALSLGGAQSTSAHDCDDQPTAVAKAQCETVHETQGEDHDKATPTPTPEPTPQVGGEPDNYVIEGPNFVDQQANEVSEFVLVVEDKDGLNPDYSGGGNEVTIRFTRHDEVPDLGDVGGLQPGAQCLPDDAELVDPDLQTQLLASASCVIQLDLTVEGMDRFSIRATMVDNNTRLGISLSTMPGNILEDTHTLTFLNPQEPQPTPTPPAPPPASDCYSVTGHPDTHRDDVRPLSRPAHPTNPQIGQNTIEVVDTTDPNSGVAVTVTVQDSPNCKGGEVWIRFLDANMNVFGTDVDECDNPCIDAAGADVTGLSSGQKLRLNVMRTLDADMALMYDQYNVHMPHLGADGYLTGRAGKYYQGTFRVHDPCATAKVPGGHFYVEVYEKDGKTRVMLENGMYRETVMCVPPHIPEATELTITVATASIQVGNDGVVRGTVTVSGWEPIPDAVKYTLGPSTTAPRPVLPSCRSTSRR